MNYRSVDLGNFEFHDAYFTFVGFANGTLTLSARHLNIHKNVDQNPLPTDMEIELATITFEGFRIESFTVGGTREMDANGKCSAVQPPCVFEGQAANDKLFNELRVGSTIYEFGILENGNYYFDGAGDEIWFQTQFLFNSAIVEWDTYRKPAWYEEKSFMV